MIRPFRLRIHGAPLIGSREYQARFDIAKKNLRRRKQIYFFYWWQCGACYLCRRRMRESAAHGHHPRTASRDHLVPKCTGASVLDNILLACIECNARRDRKPARACEIMVAQFAGEAYRAWLAT